MRVKLMGLSAAIAFMALPLLAQQSPAPPVAPATAAGQQPAGRGGGRGQTPPRYELTDQDKQAVKSRIETLDALVRAALKAKKGDDDLVADVEVHAKAGHWFLEFPQDVTVQEDVVNAIKVLDLGIERGKHLQNGQGAPSSRPSIYR